MRTHEELDAAVTVLEEKEPDSRLFDALATLYGRISIFAESPARFNGTEHQIKQAVGDAYITLANARPQWVKDRNQLRASCVMPPESEQPKATSAKRLPPWDRAMRVVSKWMTDWELGTVPLQGRGSDHEAALLNLAAGLKAVLQDDEQTRADLLAACEGLVDNQFGPPASTHGECLANHLRVWDVARAAILKAKETTDG